MKDLKKQLMTLQHEILQKLVSLYNWVLLNHAPTSTELHPPPPTSTQLILTSTQLHPPPPSSLQPSPCSLQHSQQNLNQNIARNWAIPQIQAKKLKNIHFEWKLAHMVYWRCSFRIQTQIFEIPSPKSIFGQIWAKSSKLFVLSENWYSQYVKDADSESKLRFLKF